MPAKTSPTDESSVPLKKAIDDLEAILNDQGQDIRELFGAALTIYAGAQSSSKSDDQKSSELERILFA